MPEDDGEETSRSVVEVIFRKDKTESADFEVAFSALLATGVFASLPTSTIQRTILTAAAGALLILTLIRRMGVVGRFAREQAIIEKTQIPIEFFALLCTYGVFYSLTQYSMKAVGLSYSVLLWTNIALTLLGMASIILFGLLFRGYFIFWGAYLASSSLLFTIDEEEIEYDPEKPLENLAARNLINFLQGFEDSLQHLAYVCLRNNLPDWESDDIEVLREFVAGYEQNRKHTTRSRDVVIMSGAGTLLLFGTPTAIVLYFFDLPWVLISTMAAVGMSTHVIHFLFVGYGALTEKTIRDWKWQVLGKIGYALFIIAVFETSPLL